MNDKIVFRYDGRIDRALNIKVLESYHKRRFKVTIIEDDGLCYITVIERDIK